ncbi:MAG: hypothetical protein ACREJB_11940 [Planctomycetaceae bacterium]
MDEGASFVCSNPVRSDPADRPLHRYTGTRRWDAPGHLMDLVKMGDRFESFTPAMQSLFVNLPAIEPGVLETTGEFFGSVLRLVQQRRARSSEFAELLGRVVRHLETMPPDERLRWLELLSYVHALVYHERSPAETDTLRQTIEASVQTDQHRREIEAMGKTWKSAWQVGMEEAETRGLRRALLRQLHHRFGELPAEIGARIEATEDPEQLNAWLDRVLIAASLGDMHIDAID